MTIKQGSALDCILETSDISILKQLLEYSIFKYTDLFCVKHDIDHDEEYWVGGVKGGIISLRDMYLSFEDIRLDLEHDMPQEAIFDWYWNHYAEAKKRINYQSYINGLRTENV